MIQTKTTFILLILILLCASVILFFTNQNSIMAGSSYLPRLDFIKGNAPEVYLLESGVRHWIPSPEIFNYFKFKWENIKTYTDSAIASYVQGDDWSKYDDYPEGSLLRGSGPEVYLVELGERRWIPTPEIFTGNNFGWKYIFEIDDDDLEDIDQGDNLTLSESDRYPETIISSGPEQGEVLENGDIEFRYSGTNPLGDLSELEFETFLVGHDTKWQNQRSAYTEDYDLENAGTYTFYVRAINKQGYYDPTPESVSFQLGVSAYYEKVEIKNVHSNESSSKYDYLSLYNNEDETINITGWTLTSNTDTITIPKAIKKLGYPFSSNTETDIELTKGDEVIVSMDIGPSGIDFRTNKCTGYLDQLSQHTPPLEEECPSLNISEYDHLSSVCQSFINGLDSCEIPDYSEDLAVSNDSECVGFLNDKFNYSQCYQDYSKDIDFLLDEWRVFVNKSSDVLGDTTDTLVLRDKDGLLVDKYTY